jgi:nitroreductase
MSFLSQLDWRYATKKFDASKQVSAEDKAKILNAIRMVPSSFGLQSYHVEVVTNPEIRQALKEKAYGQSQITDASFILVFSARTDLSAVIDNMFEKMSGGNADARKGLEKYEQMIRGSVLSKDIEAQKSWAAKQAYIALGFGLAATAELQIDSCPMEGFDPEGFKQVLKLPENFYPQAVLAVGYRDASDEHASAPKFRVPAEDLFTEVI